VSRESRTLEIDEDLQFQRKEWLFQRVGIGALFLFVLAALLGFTGMGGPMSRAEAGERGGAIHVEYQRIVRRGSRSPMKLHLRGAPGEVRFWIGVPYVGSVRVDSVAPAPESVSVETGRHVYLIHAGSREITVTVEVEHEAAGRLQGEVGIVGGPSVRFSQLVMF
jgi:hypothetical protein